MRVAFLGVLLSWSLSQASVLVSASAEEHYEINADRYMSFQSYRALTGEYHWSRLYTGLEYFQGPSERSGQQTLALLRHRQGGWATLSWHLFEERRFFELFYLRAGLGGFQNHVETTFAGTTSRDSSRIYASGFGGIGLNFKLMPSLFTAVEWKLIFGESQDQFAVGGVLVRLGWEFFRPQPTTEAIETDPAAGVRTAPFTNGEPLY